MLLDLAVGVVNGGQKNLPPYLSETIAAKWRITPRGKSLQLLRLEVLRV